ncbi:MAG: 16S rRNA (uracil(1498)-N(3))-methyltransferase [Candidatus Sericytochromatia bacterium]|nr:16S rRNA (uracil(1498)-N(3))-methyltransferase [Candidatus Sericytochromatia bacterium]
MSRFLEQGLSGAAGPGRRVVLGKERAHQLGRVLRLVAGDELVLVDGAGSAWRAGLRDLSPREAVVELLEPAESAPEWRRPAVLACAVLKGDRQEWLLEKVVELGLPVLQPLLTARTLVRPVQDGAKLQRWDRLVAEATEQCERAVRMELREPLPLSSLQVPVGWALLLVDESAPSGTASLEAWQAAVADAPGVVACVGPEGGWTSDERLTLLARGAVPVSLGGTIMRAETAALATVIRLGLLLA